MRCPKCKLITFEGNTICPRCGEDLSSLAQEFGPFYQFNVEEVFLKDTLLTPPPFIGAPGPPEEISPEESVGAEMPELELPAPPSDSEAEESPAPLVVEELTGGIPTGESSSEEAPSEEDVFKELEEALREN